MYTQDPDTQIYETSDLYLLAAFYANQCDGLHKQSIARPPARTSEQDRQHKGSIQDHVRGPDPTHLAWTPAPEVRGDKLRRFASSMTMLACIVSTGTKLFTANWAGPVPTESLIISQGDE